MFERQSGDGFIRCGDGHVRWGIFGAAGVVFVHHDDDGIARVMLQKRSAFAHEGGTWSCAGGALDQGEMPIEGALREATEEVGHFPDTPRIIGEYVFRPSADWAYTTVVVGVDRQFGESINFETDAVGWFETDQVTRLPLHAGFAAAWPHVRELVETDTDANTGTDSNSGTGASGGAASAAAIRPNDAGNRADPPDGAP